MSNSRYNHSIIYKLCCKDPTIEDFYIGSTCNFYARRRVHKYNCKTLNYPVYQFIRDHGGWDNWTMIQLLLFSCTSKAERLLKERGYIETLKPTLNYSIPGRSKAEYGKTEKRKEQMKKYFAQPEKIKMVKIRAKNYFQKTKNIIIQCSCGIMTKQHHLSRHKKSSKHNDNFVKRIKSDIERFESIEAQFTTDFENDKLNFNKFN